MTFGSEMRELAVELVNEFSEELGVATYFHKTGTVYNPVSGTSTDAWVTESFNVVTSKIKEDSVYDLSFVKEHFKATIAKDDMTLTPTIDDILQLPDGRKHRVVDHSIDMYSSVVTLILQKSYEV